MLTGLTVILTEIQIRFCKDFERNFKLFQIKPCKKMIKRLRGIAREISMHDSVILLFVSAVWDYVDKFPKCDDIIDVSKCPQEIKKLFSNLEERDPEPDLQLCREHCLQFMRERISKAKYWIPNCTPVYNNGYEEL